MASGPYQDLAFPLGGIDRSMAFGRQPVRNVEGQYVKTTPEGVNVRAYEPSANRMRGGQRPGLSRFINARVNGTSLIQGLDVVVGTQGSVVQTSQSGRVVTLVAVSQGVVYAAPAGATAWTAANLGGGLSNPVLNSTGIVMSAPNIQKLWMVDGTNSRYYDPSTNTIYPWTATAGAFPVDSSGNKPRHVCTWRGRTGVSGLLYDPQNVFLSAVGAPTDFDYGPVSITPTQAVAFNSAPFGLVGDVVTALVPYTDDVLFIGGDSTLWVLRGDPMAGGQLDRISDAIGMAWGAPWCKDPMGTVYFFSNQCRIHAFSPGQPPQPISQGIDPLLKDVNTGSYTIRFIWSDRYQGLHVFITKTASAAATTHYFWEKRTGAWWQDVYANTNHNPLACCVFDGNLPGDRAALIGSWDGYVRVVDPDASADDGTPIASSVVLGPLNSKDLWELRLENLQPVFGEDSGDVSYAVYVGNTAEEALASDPVDEGTWEAGRGNNAFVRRAGHSIFVKITATNPWALEAIRCEVYSLGKVRGRGRAR